MAYFLQLNDTGDSWPRPMDLILVLLISEAVSGAFGESSSVLDGVILAAILLTWNFAINVASFH